MLADPEIELIGIPDKTADGEAMDDIAYNAVIETLRQRCRSRAGAIRIRSREAIRRARARRGGAALGQEAQRARCTCWSYELGNVQAASGAQESS